jgi:negative regulator of sigma E activity
MVTVMNERKEKISAFLDNDMHRDELMSFYLSAEPDDAKIAQRYQIVGETLRGEMSDSSFVDVSRSVRAALANENIFDEVTPIKTESISDKRGLFDISAWGISAWLRPVAGMAVAVSVAVVMVVTLSGQETGSQTPVATNPATVNPGQQPVVRVAVDDKAMMEKTVVDEIINNKAMDIDQHLVNQHLKFATQDALQGRLPYVRAVSFESKP